MNGAIRAGAENAKPCESSWTEWKVECGPATATGKISLAKPGEAKPKILQKAN